MFFEDKEPDFLWQILPLLRPMKVHAKDALYNQGDLADEVFFILKGRVKLYVDLNEGKGPLLNVPFIVYVESSYFGDSDVLASTSTEGRDATAIAETEC